MENSKNWVVKKGHKSENNYVIDTPDNYPHYAADVWTGKEDAMVMAAAWDLLDALETLVEFTHPRQVGYKMAIAAIKKAKGL